MTSELRPTEAGEELNALVAEKVMGWQWASQYNLAILMSPHQFKYEVTVRPAMGWKPGIASGARRVTDGSGVKDFGPVPDYSRDIAVAWLVVEAMRAHSEEYAFRCDDNLNALPWFAAFSSTRTHFPDSHEGHGMTLPLAICLAALKALGEDSTDG